MAGVLIGVPLGAMLVIGAVAIGVWFCEPRGW